MKTFADWDEICQASREIHVAALEARKEKARSPDYDARQDMIERIEEAAQKCIRLRSSMRVYFLQEKSGGAIKIGTSSNVACRVRSLSSGIPYELILLATMPGGHRVEALTHQLFADARIRSEWFRPVSELIEYIETLRLRPLNAEK